MSCRWLLRALALVMIVAALWRDKPYHLDLASHFLPHAAAGLGFAWLLTAIVAPRPRLREGLVWTLALVVLTFWLYRPVVIPPGAEPGFERVRVATYNTYSRYNEARLAGWLEEERVDVLALVDPPWFPARSVMLPEALKAHTLVRPRGLHTAMAVASRWAFDVAPIVDEVHHTNQRSFLAHGTVIVTTPRGARFLFAPMHPVSPRTERSWAAGRKEAWREAGWIREAAEERGLPWIVAGDFNSTPASRLWRDFAATSGLRSPTLPLARGTWPARAPSTFSLPIDRVWASPGVRFISATVGPELASDHRPIVFELLVPIAPAPADDGAQESSGQ